tara:strand:- start:433 stop:609 length:177 start_codon:yes stop_codon:yes gene_type:complete
MNKQQKLKLTGYFILTLLMLNLILYAMRLINWIVFWGVILIGFVFVKQGLPWLKKRIE